VHDRLNDGHTAPEGREEREQLLAREQAARAEAEAANRMKDEFLATLSHELHTPQRDDRVDSATAPVSSMKLPPARAGTIDRHTESLAQLIEDVLDVSRIITGKLRLFPSGRPCVIEAVPCVQQLRLRTFSSVPIRPSAGLVLGDPTLAASCMESALQCS